jgi:hypothetical protein
MQAELGGWEVVLSSCLEPRFPGLAAKTQISNRPVATLGVKDSQDKKSSPLLEGWQPKSDGVYLEKGKKSEPNWQSVSSISDFYNSIKTHSVYTKRDLEFFTPVAKINSPYILIFDSPTELTDETKNILKRLFKKLGKEIEECSITYFFKCSAKAMPREKALLAEMLKKEIELINPGKIIFFNIENKLKTFAGKPAITLYSPLELLSDKPNFKEKMIEVLNICKEEL